MVENANILLTSCFLRLTPCHKKGQHFFNLLQQAQHLVRMICCPDSRPPSPAYLDDDEEEDFEEAEKKHAITRILKVGLTY